MTDQRITTEEAERIAERVHRSYRNECAKQRPLGRADGVSGWLAAISYSDAMVLIDEVERLSVALRALAAERDALLDRIEQIRDVARSGLSGWIAPSSTPLRAVEKIADAALGEERG